MTGACKKGLKSITADYGEGRKTYCYRESDAKHFHDKKFLGMDDAVEIAINKQIRRDLKKFRLESEKMFKQWDKEIAR